MLLSTEPTRWPELQMNFYPQTTDASQSPLKHLHWNTIKINNFTFLFYILFRELGEDFMSSCLGQLLCGCLISDYLKWVEPPKTNWLVPSGIVLLHRKLPKSPCTGVVTFSNGSQFKGQHICILQWILLKFYKECYLKCIWMMGLECCGGEVRAIHFSPRARHLFAVCLINLRHQSNLEKWYFLWF